MKRRLSLICLLAAALLCAGCIEAAPARTEKRIRIIETSDLHGALVDTSSGKDETAEFRLARIASEVEHARASKDWDGVLLLDGGDLYQGEPSSDLIRGAGVRAAIDAMGYDAVALGNHEFDGGVLGFGADEQGTVPAYEFAGFSGDPDVPVLAPGLLYAGTGEPVPFVRDYAVVERAGLRIAVVGYIPDYSFDILRERIAPYRIDGSLESLVRRVRAVNAKERPDATVVLAHADPVPVAEALRPEEAVLVAGGHRHDAKYGFAESGVAYVQADAYGRGYASATLVIGPDGAVRAEDPAYVRAARRRSELWDVPENAGRLDPEVMEISRAALAETGAGLREVLGFIDVPVDRKAVTGDNGSTVAGNWVTGLMLKATADIGTVAAFYNGGGIRADLPIPDGEASRSVTVGDVYAVAPFRNSLLVYELTGKELARQLADGLRDGSRGDQMSGLTFTYSDTGEGKDRRIRILSITLGDGRAVDPSDGRTLYRVATSSFSGTRGGSVFEKKTPLIPADEAPVDCEAFVAILRAESAGNGGRIPVDTGPRGTLG